MDQNGPPFSKNLTPGQALPLPAYACAASMREGAIRAHIGRSTPKKRTHEAHFRSEQSQRDWVQSGSEGGFQTRPYTALLLQSGSTRPGHGLLLPVAELGPHIVGRQAGVGHQY